MRRVVIQMFCGCVLLAVLCARVSAADDGKTAFPGVIGSKAEFTRFVTDKNRTLEIDGGFVTKDKAQKTIHGRWAATGTFGPGQTVDMEFHILEPEANLKLNTKSFPAPHPVLYVKQDGKMVELPFEKGACCSGTQPFSLGITSLMAPGEYEIKVNVEYPPGNKLPEKIYKLTVENPNFGQIAADPEVDALKAQAAGAITVVLQQGAPVPEWKLAAYQGCQDTYMHGTHTTPDRNADNANFGGVPDLSVGFYGQERRGLIQFELAGVPSAATVKKALLKIHLAKGGPLGITAYPVLQAWNQGIGNGSLFDKNLGKIRNGECSWLKRMSPDTTWAEPGCGKPAVDRAESGFAAICPQATRSNASLELVWVTWDVTAAVQGWVKDATGNHGLVLVGSRQVPVATLRASEYNDPDYRPKLIVQYK